MSFYVEEQVARVRKAVYGVEVRDSIASAIESIDKTVDDYNAQELQRDKAEIRREQQEASREEAEQKREEQFGKAEIDRNAIVNDLKQWMLESDIIGHLPVIIDEGVFGDTTEGRIYDEGVW